MATVVVWFLISMSTGHHNYGTVTVIGKFLTEEDCQSMNKNLPGLPDHVETRCVKGKVIKDWK